MNKILSFLASDDEEMVRLGLSMVKSQPRNHWNLYIEYINGKFHCMINEDDDFIVTNKYPEGLWTQLDNSYKYTYNPSPFTISTTPFYGGPLVINTNGTICTGTITTNGTYTINTNDSQ